VPLGVGVGLADGLGVAAGRVDLLVAAGVPEGVTVPPGVAWAVWRLDGVAAGRVVGDAGAAGWVAESPAGCADPWDGAAGLGRTYT
jgi:hypothetical protein